MNDVYTITNFLKNEVISIEKNYDTSLVPIHSHEFIEMIYICSGEAVHIYKGKKIRLQKNDYVFVDYNIPHCLCEKSEDFSVINCLFIPEFIDTALKNQHTFSDVLSNYLIGICPIPEDSGYVFHDSNSKAELELNLMLEEFKNKRYGYVQIIRSGLVRIIVTAMRSIEALNRNSDLNIRRMTEFAEKNFADKNLLKKISGELGYSESSLSMLFKKTFGVTYTQYIRQTRIRVSCHMLLQTDLSVEEIAERSGYADVRTFRKNFKCLMGTTPLKYRFSFTDSPRGKIKRV